ncbi:MAG: hypothetical protein AB1894_26880 [Chloroflexota bacterium]
MPAQIYIAVIVILAALLDLALMFWLRYRYTRRSGGEQPGEGRVYLFGLYSPVLTWLKKRGVGRPEGDAAPAPQPAQAPQAVPAQDVSGDGPRACWLEWGLIGLLVLAFCAGFLDFNGETRLPGNEAEFFQLLDWVLVNGLRQSGQVPLWNPYARTGLPHVADPMLHLYNPLVTLPVLLFGVNAGFKLAVFLSFLAAALGMWWLASVLGMSRPLRLWAALMYAFAGQPVARFFQGEYLFVLGFAWIPWAVGSLILVGRTRRRLYISLSALFLALLFFCGNAYYQFLMLFVAILCVAVMVTSLRRRPPFVHIDLPALRAYVLAAVLALGLIAIQLLPLVEIWPRMSKDFNLEGSHNLRQILLDYTSKDTYRLDAYRELPAREEFYAYIGLSPFLALGLLPFAIWKRQRRPLVFLGLLLLFVLAWIGLKYLPWYPLYVRSQFLLQFRHLLRALVFGSFAILLLAALALDTLWRTFEGLSRGDPGRAQGDFSASKPLSVYLSRAGLVLMGVFLLIGPVDLFQTHRPYLQNQEIYQPAYRVMGWLGQQDSSAYYVRHYPSNNWYDAIASTRQRNLGIWYPFTLGLDVDGMLNRRPVQAEARYLIQADEEPPPEIDGAALLGRIEGQSIYVLGQSLPLAFGVDKNDLLPEAGSTPLRRDEVTPFTPFFLGPNDVEVIADGGAEQHPQGRLLVVLVTLYPGWSVRMDGQPRPLRNVGGYLAVDLLPGVHKYRFSFRPAWFYLGLLVSLSAAGLAFYWLARDLPWRAGLRQARGWLGELKDLPGRRWPRPGLASPAVYRQGTLQLPQPLGLPDETSVQVSVEAQPAGRTQVVWRRWLWATLDLAAALLRAPTPQSWLFAAALGIYLLIRLVGLTHFPIYFFTDEAIQTLRAAELVSHHLQDVYGEFLPTYFRNVDQYNLGASVYIQVIPYLLFGKSVVVTRGICVLITLFAAVSVGLILRDIFELPYWWSATLFLSMTPAWFLHSRTAFETTLMVSFYAAALYFYLLYRCRSPRFLFTSLVLFSLAFYSYSPGQVVVVVTGLLLLVSDWHYHWQNRTVTLRALVWLFILALPYLRFRINHPSAVGEHLANLNSYWIQNLPLREKLADFFKEYLYGLNPGYWFFPNERDLDRHLMKGYGHLLMVTLPLVVVGLLVTLRSYFSSPQRDTQGGAQGADHRRAAYRALLVALLAAPAGAALAQIAITRALVMVIPASLLAAIGAVVLLSGIEKVFHLPRPWLETGLFGVLALLNVWVGRDALVNGPTWYQDYGLGGMQYGGEQLFKVVKDYLAEHPDTRLILTPTWANGPDVVARFFLGDPLPIQMGSIDEYMNQRLSLEDDMVFVMTPDEYVRVGRSGKFKDIHLEQTLSYPNGMPGFYFVRLAYVDNIQAILDAERQARRQLQEDEMVVNGQIVKVRHSMLDMGPISAIMDGSPRSVARTLEANPFIIELTFPDLRPLSGLSVITGDTEIRLLLRLYPSLDAPPVEYVFDVDGSIQDPGGSVNLPTVQFFRILYLEITDLRQGDPGHVHLWELNLR